MTSLLTVNIDFSLGYSCVDLDFKAILCTDIEGDPYYCFVDINSGAVFIRDNRDISDIPDIAEDVIYLIGVWDNISQSHTILTPAAIKWADNYSIPVHPDAWPRPRFSSRLRKMNAYEQRKISIINRKTFLKSPGIYKD